MAYLSVKGDREEHEIMAAGGRTHPKKDTKRLLRLCVSSPRRGNDGPDSLSKRCRRQPPPAFTAFAS
jgi:hypothetical protein